MQCSKQELWPVRRWTRWKDSPRWVRLVGAAIAVNFLFGWLLLPAFMSPSIRVGLIATLLAVIPIIWGIYAIFTCQNERERVVGWVAFSISLVHIEIVISGIIQAVD